MAWQPRRWASEKPAEEKAEAEGAKAEAEDAGKVDERVAKLEKQLEEKTTEAKDMKEKMLYAVADADNARRVAKIDIDKARNFSVGAIAKDMLEVVDTLAKAVDALEHLDEETAKKAAPVLTGVKMSHKILLHNLGRHGIEKIEAAKGVKFDPNVHEALFRAPVTEDVPAEHISAVVKDGYMLKDRVLRAAQVGVAEQD